MRLTHPHSPAFSFRHASRATSLPEGGKGVGDAWFTQVRLFGTKVGGRQWSPLRCACKRVAVVAVRARSH